MLILFAKIDTVKLITLVLCLADPSGLRQGSAADRLLGLGVRIPPGAWMFVL
jgi:hypothetical protein